MNQRGYPLWLLRDWTAFIAVLITFWTLIFAGFRAGRRAARGRKVSDLELQTLFQLYANAESRLDHAIWRQAWRACGYSAKHAAFVQMPAPTNTQELEARFHGYQRALRDMELLVVAYADDLRRRFKLSRAQVAIRTLCALRRSSRIMRLPPSAAQRLETMGCRAVAQRRQKGVSRPAPAARHPITDCPFHTASARPRV